MWFDAMSTSESFEHLARRLTDPIQHDYEVIRGVMLEDESIAERSRITCVDRDTISEKARRFIQEGMFGLADHRTTTENGRHCYPPAIAAYSLYLKQLYPAIHYREIGRIIERKYGYKSHHRTIKRFLERHPISVQLPLEITRFHQFEDAYRARFTVVRMYYEGWHQQSIGVVSANPLRLAAMLSVMSRQKTARHVRCHCRRHKECWLLHAFRRPAHRRAHQVPSGLSR
jgi:hypothetical protein